MRSIFSTLLTSPQNKARLLSDEDARLRKRDEARIAILEQDRANLEMRIAAGHDGGLVEITMLPRGEGHVRLTRAQQELAGLNQAIEKLRTDMVNREAATAREAERQERRRTTMPAEVKALELDAELALQDLAAIRARIVDMAQRAKAMQDRYGRVLHGHHLVEVPEITKLILGWRGLGEVFIGPDSKVPYWLQQATEIGLHVEDPTPAP